LRAGPSTRTALHCWPAARPSGPCSTRWVDVCCALLVIHQHWKGDVAGICLQKQTAWYSPAQDATADACSWQSVMSVDVNVEPSQPSQPCAISSGSSADDMGSCSTCCTPVHLCSVMVGHRTSCKHHILVGTVCHSSCLLSFVSQYILISVPARCSSLPVQQWAGCAWAVCCCCSAGLP
jgi:hypothetical protein